MTWRIRPATADDAELATIAALVNAVAPERPTSVEEIRWGDATYPGGRRYVAESGGRIVGHVSVGRIYMYPEAYERLWLGIEVEPAFRRRGIGAALLHAASGHARGQGKTGLEADVSEAQADGLAFLGNRGFVETERTKSVRLDLAGLAPPTIDPPSGIEIVTLAARPELLPGVHAVAQLAFPDVPHAGTPIAAGDLDEFRARDVERPGIPADAFQVAIIASTGVVVGYANMQMIPGRAAAWHDMTAVHPDHRGRGIASALKRATIAWAIRAGLDALETGNDVANGPMRAVNARLGYRPMPDEISLRGPLSGGIMGT